ncbi:MAG: threonine/serine exporter family protein [Ornithinimicrobium sp.]
MQPEDAEPDEAAVRTLVAHLGAAMVGTGQPVHEIEQELAEVAARWGYPELQVGAAPTSLTFSLSSGASSTFQRVSGGLSLDQAADVRRIRHLLVFGDLGVGEALDELASLRRRAGPYPSWLTQPAYVVVCLGIALILQPGWANLVVVCGCGVVVVALLALARRFRVLSTLLPTVAAFIVTAIVFGLADAGVVQGPLRTVLPPLAALLPGALIVTGMSELAAAHMQAGASRLVYGMVQLGLFALGLVAATTLLRVPDAQLVNLRVDELGWFAAPVGLLLIAVGISLMENVPMRMAPWVLLVLVLAFAAQSTGQLAGSSALGGFLGAVAASLGATAVELFRPRLARLVLFLPAFWLLVPGSLGLLGVTQLVAEQPAVLAAGVDIAGVVCAIALGLLFGSAIGEALRRRVRPDPLA